MLRPLLAAALLATPAVAAERTVGIGSFERVRVEGAFDVRIATGRSPRATLSGDPRVLDRVELSVDGTTLRLRRRGGVGAALRSGDTPVVVTLAAPTLAAAAVIGGATLRIAGMRGARADLSVGGAGNLAVEGLDAQEVSASVFGGGGMTLAGRAGRALLATSGGGTIDAGKLVANELVVRSDGPGETSAQARYLATVSSSGSGRVVVAGSARCVVRAPAGTVTCGR